MLFRRAVSCQLIRRHLRRCHYFDASAATPLRCHYFLLIRRIAAAIFAAAAIAFAS
jgi:hypothetical protein